MRKGKRRQLEAKDPLAHWGGISDPEILDTTPVEIPLGCSVPTPLSELIARAVHAELDRKEAEGLESWDEANDFEEEDPEALDMSAYELTEMEPEESGYEVREAASEAAGEPQKTPEPSAGEDSEGRPEPSE